MKKFIYILAISSITAAGCDNKLDINPEESLSTELAFADRNTSFASLIGVYSRAQDLYVFGSLPQVISDFQADNVNFVGSFPTLQDISRFQTIATNSSIRDIWRNNFRVIAAANAIIKNVPGVDDPTFSEEEKGQFVAEARFLRAITNFQLVNLFAQPYNLDNGASLGIPIVLEPFEGEITYPSRATVNEVHQQIIADIEAALPALMTAEAYLDSEGAEMARGRATQGAAKALLARLHLYRGEYQQAADLAADVMDDPGYNLAGNYNFYDGNTAEDIFTIQMSEIDNSRTGAGGWASYYTHADDGGRGDCLFSDDLIAAFEAEAGDKRFDLSKEVNGDLFTTKFPDGATNSDNAPVIRITEMYLTAAEALAELNGVNAPSLNLMNELRERAGLDAWTAADFANDQEFVEAILNERRKELCFEGHRRMDLLRKGKSLRTSGDGAGESAPGDERVILPIPQSERDVNSNLEQNSGY